MLLCGDNYDEKQYRSSDGSRDRNKSDEDGTDKLNTIQTPDPRTATFIDLRRRKHGL